MVEVIVMAMAASVVVQWRHRRNGIVGCLTAAVVPRMVTTSVVRTPFEALKVWPLIGDVPHAQQSPSSATDGHGVDTMGTDDKFLLEVT